MINIFHNLAHTSGGGSFMVETKKWKPGEQAPKSATYVAYDEDGRCGGSLYLEKGKRFPATQNSGSYYVEEE